MLRGAAFALLALMLVVRLGPVCEATAIAAAPAMTVMAGWEGKLLRSPDKKPSQAACATPCVAIPGHAVAYAEPAANAGSAPWPASQPRLTGPPIVPAATPPRPA